MNLMESLAAYLPMGLWVMASGCLLLLMLVIFGYHLYQRSRFKALIGDCASLGELAAKRDSLSAEVGELRNWLAQQRPERLKMEAERHQQEVARADLTRLQAQLREKRAETQKVLAQISDLDLILMKRRQLQTRLEAEIRALEEQREELAPMEKYAQELRLELDKGKSRLGQIAQEEVRTQALQTQAQLLRQEVADLNASVVPLREEQTRLRHFIDQARHSVAVKNEQLMEQKQQLRQMGQGNAELAQKKRSLMEASHLAENRHKEVMEALANSEELLSRRQGELEQLRNSFQAEQIQMELLIQRKEERTCEVFALESRKALLEKELEAAAVKIGRTLGAKRNRRKRTIAKPPQAHTKKTGKTYRSRPESIFCHNWRHHVD